MYSSSEGPTCMERNALVSERTKVTNEGKEFSVATEMGWCGDDTCLVGAAFDWLTFLRRKQRELLVDVT